MLAVYELCLVGWRPERIISDYAARCSGAARSPRQPDRWWRRSRICQGKPRTGLSLLRYAICVDATAVNPSQLYLHVNNIGDEGVTEVVKVLAADCALIQACTLRSACIVVAPRRCA